LICTHCKFDKKEDEFSKNGWCLQCNRDNFRRYSHNNPEKIVEINKRSKVKRKDRNKELLEAWIVKNYGNTRNYHLYLRYGITPEQYNEMVLAQNGCCAGCLRHQSELKRPLCVDHDHSCCPGDKTCGECIRGLLCWQCNGFLGSVGDSIESLERLIQYLKNSPSTKIVEFGQAI
jgi:hypothetical protein